MRSFGTKRVYCNELGRRPEEDRDSRRLGGGGRVYLLHECARWSGGGDQKKSGATGGRGERSGGGDSAEYRTGQGAGSRRRWAGISAHAEVPAGSAADLRDARSHPEAGFAGKSAVSGGAGRRA